MFQTKVVRFKNWTYQFDLERHRQNQIKVISIFVMETCIFIAYSCILLISKAFQDIKKYTYVIQYLLQFVKNILIKYYQFVQYKYKNIL